jgi:hypothetical protein
MTSKSTLLRAFISTTLSVLLVACGGGGGGSTVGTNFSITGTAATGAAISSGTVEAKCKSGTGTATTNYDGTFTVDISNGFLPLRFLEVARATAFQLLLPMSTTANWKADICALNLSRKMRFAAQDISKFNA